MDFLLACQENQHITHGQLSMDFEAFLDSSLTVIFWCLFLIVDSNWEHPCLHVDDGYGIIKKSSILEILDSHGGTHDDKPQRMTLAL